MLRAYTISYDSMNARWMLTIVCLGLLWNRNGCQYQANAWTLMPIRTSWPPSRSVVRTLSYLNFGDDLPMLDNMDGRNRNSTETIRNNDTLNGASTTTTTKGVTTTATAKASVISSGRNNFGDIMSPTVDDEDVLCRDGLVTSSTYSLAKRYGIHHPLDRMAVTANGNLQRLFSSYYDAPVTVIVDHCIPTKGDDSCWDRRVQLHVYGQTFCVADSHIQVHSAHCKQLVESGQVGLGQLFRYLNILPEFALQDAGPTEEGGFWRHYTLTCADVSCSITERFCPGVWELKTKNDAE